MNRANLKRIKQIAEDKGMTLKGIASKVGITQAALSLLIKENSTRVDTLIKIADVLDVPVTNFFETDYGIENSNNGVVGGDFMINSQKEAGMAIEALINQLKAKDRQIDSLINKLNANV